MIRSAFARLFDLDAEPPEHFFTTVEIGRLQSITHDPRRALDEQTWRDLLLETYEERLAQGSSIFGRQLLHRRLRDGLDDADCAALGERLRALSDDPARLDALTAALRPLRHAGAEVAGLLFEDTPPPRPAWAPFTWVLPLMLLVSLGLLVTQPLGWLATIAALAPLMALQVRYHRRLEMWKNTLDSLNALLAASGKLAPQPETARLHKRLAGSLVLRAIPLAEPYLNWFAAYNVGRYWKTIGIVDEARAFLRTLYMEAATVEADVALARHLRDREGWCWAERGAPRELMLEEGIHPLMDKPSALSVTLEGRGAFISGQNASGKSTFLRMVGLNLVAARAFGFCYAKRARLPAVPVRASMQNEDSLLGGESLYMSELRRARELLDSEPAGVCLIDEVFRGTNHLESVSAAGAVLERLARRDLVLVSSHNLVLARILADGFDPLRIDTGSGAPMLVPGVLREPNGIALLATQGFGPEIEGRAADVARWLNAHLENPTAA